MMWFRRLLPAVTLALGALGLAWRGSPFADAVSLVSLALVALSVLAGAGLLLQALLPRALAIATKELTIYLTTRWAWAVFTVMAALSSFFFLALLQQFKQVQEVARQFGWHQLPPEAQAFRNLTDGVVVSLWGTVLVVTLFVAPFLSMRLFAEERRQKTLELLLTSPIRPIDIVLGKYLGGVGIIACTLGVTIVYPLTLTLFGQGESGAALEWSTILLGYFGLLLWGATCMALGMFVSSLTESQMVSAVIAFAVALVWMLLRSLAPETPEPWRAVLSYVSFDGQLQNLLKGVLDLRPIVLFSSMIAIFLFLTHRALEATRWELALGSGGKTMGKLAGGLGLLLVLTSPITLLAATSPTPAIVKLGLGLLLVAVWAVTNRATMAAVGRSTFFFSTSVVLGALLVTALAATNLIVARRHQTWDLTNKKIFSLAPQTIATLKALDEPVHAINFVRGPPPPPVENLFRRYRAETDQLTWEFKDPSKDWQAAQQYSVRENQPATVLVKGRGEKKTHTTIALTKIANAAMGEQELTNGLIKLHSTGAQRLYFLQGHGEWPLTAPDQSEDGALASLALLVRAAQDDGYEPQSLSLVEQRQVPADASALVIAGPRSRFTDPELVLLQQWMDRGGRLLVFLEPGSTTGLEPLFSEWGLQLEPGLLADSANQTDNPYVIVTPFYGEHEITQPLKTQKLPAVFSTALAFTILREGTPADVTAKPLVLSSPTAWVERTPTATPTLDGGEKTGQLPIGVVLTRDTKASKDKLTDEARLVVFGDSDMLTSALPFNRNLVMNTLAWTTQQAHRITIRPPDRDMSTIDLSEEQFARVRLLTFDAFPVLLMAIGLIISLSRRAR